MKPTHTNRELVWRGCEKSQCNFRHGFDKPSTDRSIAGWWAEDKADIDEHTIWKLVTGNNCLLLPISDIWASERSLTLLIACCCWSHVWLFCSPMNCTHQAPLSMGFPQARILEWITISSSKGSSWSRDQTHILHSCIGRQILYHWATREAHHFWLLDEVKCRWEN